jgi:hypothetical protein
VSEFRYFESGYFEPFFDSLFGLEEGSADSGGVGFFGTFFGASYGTFYGPVEEEDVLRQVSGWSEVVFPRRKPRRRDDEVDDEEALIALLLAATR